MQRNNTIIETDQAIAGAVRAELARRKVSQQQLTERTGWSKSFLARRVHGTVPFTVAELLTLSRAVGVEITELIPSAEDRNRGTEDAAMVGAPSRLH